MEQLIHAFGIDIKLIVVQIVNFGLLFWLLTYFLYKPVLKFLSEREAKIKQGIENAEEASVRLQEAESEKKEIVSEAHKEAENIAERARVHAGEKSSEIVSEAETRAASLVLDTEKRCDLILP